MTRARDIASATTPNANAALLATFPHRNLIINGAMQVAQRGTSTSSVTTSIYGACDRQKYYRAAATDELVVTISQSTDAPTEFKYSHKVQVTTAEASIDADDLICPLYSLNEGQNLQHLSYGTSDAKATTVSFWVKSNVTGVFSITVYNNNSNRLVTPTYTISSADTWEYKTLTIPADQTGTIANVNTNSFDFYFNAMVGSNFTSGTSAANAWATYAGSNWCVGHTAVWGSSTSDYWQITGLQLELGETATPFEHRSYSDELAACQRYYESLKGAFYNNTSAAHLLMFPYKGVKRAVPTVTRTANFWSGGESGPTLTVYNDTFVCSGATTSYLGGWFTVDAEL